MFRIGEVTASDHIVKAKDVHIAVNKDKLLFILRTSKTHSKGTKPQIIKIEGIRRTNDSGIRDLVRNSNTAPLICPFQLLKEYLAIRPSYRELNSSSYSPIIQQ